MDDGTHIRIFDDIEGVVVENRSQITVVDGVESVDGGFLAVMCFK